MESVYYPRSDGSRRAIIEAAKYGSANTSRANLPEKNGCYWAIKEVYVTRVSSALSSS